MRKQEKNIPLFIEIVSALLLFLFLYTSISKLKDHHAFQVVLAKSPLLGTYSVLLSWAIPAVEIITSALLFIPATRKRGLQLSFTLMLFFTTYIAYMILFASNLPCSCGGVLQELSWTQHLVFNIIFLLLNIFALWHYRRNELFIAINRNSRTPV
jgi:hypothetical protein